MNQRKLRLLLKGLGGGPRLAILTHLKKHQRASVSDVAAAIHRSITTASIHLSHLERLNVVSRRRRANAVFYRLSIPQNPIARCVLKAL